MSIFLLRAQGKDGAQGHGQVAGRALHLAQGTGKVGSCPGQYHGRINGPITSTRRHMDSLNCPDGWRQVSGTALHSWLLLLLKEGWEQFRCGKRRAVIAALSLSNRDTAHHF